MFQIFISKVPLAEENIAFDMTEKKNPTVEFKAENILKGNLNLIPSPSPFVKIQIMGGKVCLRCKGKTLLVVVNKLLKTKKFVDIPQ